MELVSWLLIYSQGCTVVLINSKQFDHVQKESPHQHSLPGPTPGPWLPWTCFLSLRVCWPWAFCTSRSVYSAAFWVWLLPLGAPCSPVTRVVARPSALSLVRLRGSPLCAPKPRGFGVRALSGCHGRCCWGHECMRFCGYVSVSLGYLGTELLLTQELCVYLLEERCTIVCFFRGVCGFQRPASSRALGFWFFDLSRSRGSEVVSHGFSPNHPMNHPMVGAPFHFHVRVGHSQVFSGNVSSDPLPILKSDSLSFYCYKNCFVCSKY